MNEESIVFTIDGSSGSPDLERAFLAVVSDMFTTFKLKQASYGSANIGDFGEIGVLIRSYDKIQRLKRMVWEQRINTISDESIQDTWQDLGNYAIIAQMVKAGLWG
jgi:hypothetical protein